MRNRVTLCFSVATCSGGPIETPQSLAGPLDDFVNHSRSARTGQRKSQEVPQSGPALAGGALPQQHPAGAPHDDGGFVHGFAGRLATHPRNLVLQAALIARAQLGHGTSVAARHSGRANQAAQFHQSLVEHPASRAGTIASATCHSRSRPAAEATSPRKAIRRLNSRTVLASRIGARVAKAIDTMAPAV